MDSEVKKWIFETGQECPGSWLIQAMSLKVAADRLYWGDNPVKDDEATVSLVGPYKMLIGLAFENLLKGIILLNKLDKTGISGLPKECFHHNINDLFEFLGDFEHSLDDEEKTHLINLSPFIEWAGRYHLPKKEKDIVPVQHSNIERKLELSAWEKLSSYIIKNGWVMKGGAIVDGGYRLYFDK